ncbi:2Fe-2S iron-sulfur cluster-binding protein [Amphritea sp. 2_MG-2023]|uniref:2Fe-2S iron-sulfur cluster-binding protein n=1 Tax=Amphritea TaxID=515417 RepID=UPI001C071663|nr:MULTISPECIES: 2Fe-2S iron-sulfur cluster-binding protein [Amphritea]MBU2964561.1 pyridoxamine 5'-phosphate oxidase family protein [Amphritea atlantica]MDO6417890.1 2Fe-2S iron-sulfur cluster-binding protein [Amphritea sp. 2_MG-2023]
MVQKTSQFHAAEIKVQERLGVAGLVAQTSEGFIRQTMLAQHRQFFHELPFIVLGLVDQQGYSWAVPLFGKPGFISSPNETTLALEALPTLTDLLALDFTLGQKVGALGIQLQSRRRNRLNGIINTINDKSFTIKVEQSFGNCPQYIQKRELEWQTNGLTESPLDRAVIMNWQSEQAIDQHLKTMIEQADTFFIASRTALLDTDPRHGIDASHRGGKPGFIKVEGNTLYFPDFSGNRFFNTLGNIESDGRVGLFFPDFTTGDAAFITGQAKVLWQHPAIPDYQGAERIIAVHIEKSTHLSRFMPMTGVLKEPSPMLDGTGRWHDLAATAADQYQPVKVIDIQPESDTVSSFYLAPLEGQSTVDYTPGQFLPLQLTVAGLPTPLRRSYTLSQAPKSGHYRISVKREQQGLVSKALHDQLAIGDCLQVAKPAGQFTLQPTHQPIVLISGGIGITPMIAMLEGLVKAVDNGVPAQPVWFIHACQNSQNHAFAAQLTQLAKQYDWLSLHTLYSKPLPQDKINVDYQAKGRLSTDRLKHLLPIEQYDVYLCGSSGFMRSLFQGLLEVGVAKTNIYYEFFAEGSIEDDEPTANPAEQACIRFADSDLTAQWHTTDGSLLEFAEAQGISAPHSCRAGNCGACACRLTAGEVAYEKQPSFTTAVGEVLICCAKPAEGSTEIVIDI